MKRLSLKIIGSPLVQRMTLFTILLSIALGVATIQAQEKTGSSQSSEIRELKIGEPIEQELSAREAHSYRVTLSAGQFLRVVVEQKGIDVVVTLFAPGGQKLSEVDSPNGNQGPEPVSSIAQAAGEYRLEVKSLEEKVPPGRYQVKVEELRDATPKDGERIEAERLLAEAELFRVQGTGESVRKAIKKYEEALPLWSSLGDQRKQGEILHIIGLSYNRLSESQKALEIYSEALRVRRLAGDRFGETQTLINMGSAHYSLSQFQKTIQYLSEALILARQLGSQDLEIQTLTNLGTVYTDSDQQKALDYYNEALSRMSGLKQPSREAYVLNGLGTLYWEKGEPRKALDSHQKALELHSSIGDRRGEAATLTNMAMILRSLGEPDKALEYLNRSLALQRALGYRLGEAEALTFIASTNLSLDKTQEALTYFQQAVGIARELKNRHLEALALTGIAAVHHDRGEFQTALDYFTRILSLQREIPSRVGEAWALTQMGGAYDSMGNREQAIKYLQQALEIQRTVGARRDEATTLRFLAIAKRNLNHLDEALRQIELAINIVETSRTDLIGPQLRTSYSATTQKYYETHINLLMQMHQREPSAGYDAKALQAAERARARSLLELLTEARIDVKQGIAPPLKQREKDIQSRISRTQNLLIQTSSLAKPDRTKVTVLEEEFKKLETERAQVEVQIRQKHPRYATLHYPRPLDLKAVQKLLDGNTVLLEYSLGQEASYLFAITRDDFRTARLPAAPVITKQVTALREAIAIKPDRTALSSYFQNARSLYRDLVQPAGKLLTGKRALIIVPDGILHYLPFESLLQTGRVSKTRVDLRQLPYMIRNFTISYAPSATVLASLRKDRVTPGKSLLAFGDPIYEQKDFEQSAPIQSALRGTFDESKPWQLKQLPESRREVERIAKLYAPAQASIFLGESAREENVKLEGGPSYRFVHFAVHGLLNEKQPQYSGLVLSLSRINKEAEPQTASMSDGPMDHVQSSAVVEDGLLQVYEIFDLKLNADLVVLSACETGLGKEAKGEGLVGMTQAFLYAGTPSVAVSLWKVEDRSTSDLMFGLYRHLNNPRLTKADALRRAQLEMIRKGDFSHPYYWAGFVMIGQP